MLMTSFEKYHKKILNRPKRAYFMYILHQPGWHSLS
jgi:hypothetical protein